MRHQPIIFCPQCATLILEEASCPQCNWQRPSLGGEPGSHLWKAQLPGVPGVPYSQPAAHNGRLFIANESGGKYGARQGMIHALTAVTGKTEWQYDIPNQRVARLLTAVDDTILVATEDTRTMGADDNAFIALDAESGKERWRFPVPAHSLSSPAVADGLIFFTTNNRVGYGIDLHSGKLRWQIDDLPSWTPAPPVVGAGAFYFGSRSNVITAVDFNGKASPLWQADESGNWFPHAPTYRDGTLYLTGWNKQLHAVDVRTGKQRWAISVGRGHTSPPIAGEYLYVGAKEATRRTYSMQAINMADGNVVWRFTAERYFAAPPLLRDGLLFAPCENGRLYVLDALTGEKKWQYPLGDEKGDKLRGTPVISGDTVAFVDKRGVVNALSWRQPQPTDEGVKAADLRYQGKWEAAGSLAALQGQYGTAAKDYVQAQLPYQAAQLYEKGGQPAKAAEIYLDLDLKTHPDAAEKGLAAYRLAGDKMGEARALLFAKRFKEAGDLYYEDQEQYGLAAEAYEDAGLMTQAALCHTMAQEYDRAIEIYDAMDAQEHIAAVYHKMGDLDRAVDISVSIGDVIKAAEWLQEAGRLTDAAILLEKHHHIDQATAVWLQQGDRESATEVYVRAEQWEKAAKLWRDDDPNRAADLYLEGNILSKAAILYAQAGNIQKASVLYDKLDDIDKIIEMAVKMQDYVRAAVAHMRTPAPKLQTAARYYAKAQKWDKAAEYFERAGGRFVDDAVKNWRKAGRPERAIALLKANNRLSDAAKLLEDEQQYAEAADLWLTISPPNQQEAARLYQLAGDYQKAFKLHYDAENWEDVRRVAIEINDDEREAEACVKLALQASGEKREDLYLAAALAFQRTAEIYESNKKRTSIELAQLWEKAMGYYEMAYEDGYVPKCQSAISRLRHWPVFEVVIKAKETLVLEERHTLLVYIENVGYGTADMIFMRVTGGDFEGQDLHTQHIRGLKRGQKKKFVFGVKPVLAGSAVSLKMEVNYRSSDGKEHTLPASGNLSVHRRESQRIATHDLRYDTPTQGSTQQVIIVKEGGEVIIGDKFDGDKIESGGRKGDSVEVNHGEGRRSHIIPDDVQDHGSTDKSFCTGTDSGKHDFDLGNRCSKCGQPKPV